MNIFILICLIFYFGLFIVNTLASGCDAKLKSTLAFPLGLGVLAILIAFASIVGVTIDRTSCFIIILSGCGALGIYLTISKKTQLITESKIYLYFLLGILITSFFLEHFRVVLMTNDSYTMLALGRSIFISGEINSEFLRQASSMGSLCTIIMGLSDLVGKDFWASFIPLSLLSLFGTMYLVGRKIKGNEINFLLLGGILFLVSAPVPMAFIFYQHSNPLAAVFLSSSLALFYLYSRKADVELIYLAITLLFLFAFCRYEGPIIFAMVLAFMFPMLLAHAKKIFPLICLFSATMLSWMLYVEFNKGGGIFGFSDSNQTYILMTSICIPLFYNPIFNVARHRVQIDKIPTYFCVLLLVTNIVLAFIKPGFILGGAYYVSTILFSPKYWGLFWIAAVPLGFFAIKQCKNNHETIFLHFLFSYFLIISVFGFFKYFTYQPWWTDSAVRMSFHVAPFIVLILSLHYLKGKKCDEASG